MKIVIDVPEEEYNTGQLIHYFGCYSDKLDLVIYNGTSLPEYLNKIKDEIDLKQYSFMAISSYDEGIRFGLMMAYQIIDKYIEGSESK